MSLVWFALAARRLFSAGALKHLVVVVACALALWIQMLYRVPGTFLFLLLPWVSFAVLGLQLVFFIRYVFVPTPEALPLASTWHHVERVSGIMVRIFVYYSVLLFANVRSTPVRWRRPRPRSCRCGGRAWIWASRCRIRGPVSDLPRSPLEPTGSSSDPTNGACCGKDSRC
ncbi:MAG TPA: hypothetical protein VNQ54_09325 [Methylomirabilota bacterium]|nr:hypothetical protein [Methylomirabilota bacterium]